MILFLLLNIITTSSLFVLFKGFEKFRINTVQAIVTNYWVAVAIGYFTAENPIKIGEILSKDWMIHGAWLGLLFITFFHLIAYASQKIGVAVTTTANKMAVVIPISVGMIVYGESAVWYKLLGIIIALVAVYLTTKPKEKSSTKKTWLAIAIPILLFAGGGAMDVTLHYVQTYLVPESEATWFSTSIFISAGTLGLLVIMYKIMTHGMRLDYRSVIAGIILGIPNYGSIYFILRAIDTEVLGSSVLFPIANVGGILLATIASVLMFKERLSKLNWMGVALSVIGIFLIILEELINVG